MSVYSKMMQSMYWPPVIVSAETLVPAIVEYALGKMTAQQVIDAFALDAAEQQEVQALYLAIRNGNASLVGATPALRALEVQNVLYLGQEHIAPYVDEAAVKARLGV